METLNAHTLKSQLWDTLHAIKDGSIDASKGDAIAAQAREILRTVKTQVMIVDRARIAVPEELVKFAISNK